MKMKFFMKVLAALAVGGALFSCVKEKGAVEPSVSLTVTPAELVFDAAGGVDQTVTVTCDTYWKAYLDAEWLEIDMEDGYLNQTITVSVPDENTAAEPLTATLTIVAGRLEKVVTITQAAGAPYLKIAAEPADNFECEADTTAFEVASNQAWTAVSGAEWLTILGFEDDVDEETEGVASFDGEGSGVVIIAAAANETNAERNATITLTSGELSANFTVTQKAWTDKVAVSPDEAAAPAAGAEIEVAVTSNTDWTVEIPADADWCAVDEASGSEDATLTFTIAANETGVPRTAVVTIKASETVSATVTFTQGRIMPAAVKKDSLALIAIYNAADGDNWKKNDDGSSKWDFNKPIYEWDYVKTDAESGRVTSLAITAKDVISTPWELPSAIGDLTELTNLRFNSQKVTGQIPAAVYGLTKLTDLYFQNNMLTGSISSAISQLTELKNFYIDRNASLEGSLPESMGNLTKLANLNIAKTSISGTVPSTMKNCASLKNFMADATKLTGIGDNWDEYPAIEIIQFINTPTLEGSLPASIGKSKTVKTVQLYNCNFTGNVPEDWGSLPTTCTKLQIYNNKLQGVLPAAFVAHANYDTWNATVNIFPQQEGYGLTEPEPNPDPEP